jgi:glycerophosphoryl diester phosphodiesterase
MLIFAHRGASADAPENTLLAIEKALEQQADGIEIDVHQLGDELVVIHDHWVHRTTNGSGQLKEYNLHSLRKLDAGKGQHVPTLWEVMLLIEGKCQLNIEIKGVKDLALLLKLIERAQRELGFEAQQFILSSFDHHILQQLHLLAPNLRLGALTASNPIHYAEFAQQLNAYSVNADVAFLDQNFVNDAKKRGLKVMVYTVDQPQELLKLRDWGVDAVFSNGPGKARVVLEAN